MGSRMEFVTVSSFSNYIDAHIMLGRLQEEGIRCWLKDENLATLYPIWTNATGGIKLMVASIQVNEAKNLLRLFEEEKRSRYSCPKCNSSNIELISSNRDPANWLSVILGFLVFSYAMATRTWRCFDCSAEFKEPRENNDAYTNSATH